MILKYPFHKLVQNMCLIIASILFLSSVHAANEMHADAAPGNETHDTQVKDIQKDSQIKAPNAPSDTLTLFHTQGQEKVESYPLTLSSQFVDGPIAAELKPISHGQLKKKVFALVTVKVYIAEFLAAKPEALQKNPEQIIASLKAASPVALRLTMLRDLSHERIYESFKDGLKVNNINPDDYTDGIKLFLEEINTVKKFNEGDIFTIVADYTDTGSSIILQKPDTTLKKISGDKNFANQILQIWFGASVDEKLGSLKKDLLK